MSHDNSAAGPSPMLRAKLVVAAAQINLRGARDRLLVETGSALGSLARRFVLRLHRDEEIPLPEPLQVESLRFDVLTDLVAYTGLPRRHVEALLRRQLDSFRAEWFLAPPELRADEWYYRATSAYLFGNAVHLHEPAGLLPLIREHCRTPGRALDFGGGTGNLALALAALGWRADHLERSALQKDFTRFRVARYALAGQVQVLDDWEPFESGTYDLICAIDVLEHVADLEGLLTKRLLPALKSEGALVEASPFHRTLSNPMHHEHTDLDALLEREGLRLEADADHYRVWRASVR